jgi:D-alanyl-D-alanine carboxypeptidase
MTTDTPTFAYSITKTFVSALVLTQIADADYVLTDTVDDLLAGDTDYDNLTTTYINKTATVEQLLTHTSGMPNYADNLDELIPQCNPAAAWKPADILENIVYQDDGPTGTFEYSNTNYILLGMIAQVEGSASLNTLLANAFFTPLTLDLKLAPQDTYPANIAHPYDDKHALSSLFPVGSFDDFAVALPAIFPGYDVYLGIGRGTWTAGGIIGRAEDIALWGWELYNDEGTAISAAVRTTLKNSATTDEEYGYGVTYNDFTYEDGTVGGTYGHGGSAPGYKSLLRYEKTKGISVAIITNTNNTVDGTGLIDQDALAEALFNAYENQ